MKIKTLKVGYLETNCYILIIDNSALIIDPGDDYEKIKENLKTIEIKGILITHNHFDHVGALSKFKNIKVYDYNNLKEGINQIDKFKFEVIYTSGHTSDSITFYFKENNIMFVGDFIFKNSIGRTDLETGNMKQMNKSLSKIKKYPKNTILYPGHGDATTIEQELKNNPFLL